MISISKNLFVLISPTYVFYDTLNIININPPLVGKYAVFIHSKECKIHDYCIDENIVYANLRGVLYSRI